MKKILLFSFIILFSLGLVMPVSASVTITPQIAELGTIQLFTNHVSVDRNIPIVSIKLSIPEGITEVVPTVKTGWKITIRKQNDKVIEIAWTEGNIPADERDEFGFSARLPNEEKTLQWIATLTYKDGIVVVSDKKPSIIKDTTGNSYSETKVSRKIETLLIPAAYIPNSSALTISLLSLIFSTVAINLSRKNKNPLL